MRETREGRSRFSVIVTAVAPRCATYVASLAGAADTSQQWSRQTCEPPDHRQAGAIARVLSAPRMQRPRRGHYRDRRIVRPTE